MNTQANRTSIMESSEGQSLGITNAMAGLLLMHSSMPAGSKKAEVDVVARKLAKTYNMALLIAIASSMRISIEQPVLFATLAEKPAPIQKIYLNKDILEEQVRAACDQGKFDACGTQDEYFKVFNELFPVIGFEDHGSTARRRAVLEKMKAKMQERRQATEASSSTASSSTAAISTASSSTAASTAAASTNIDPCGELQKIVASMSTKFRSLQ